MGYKIVLEAFQGPMDLLLHLIDEAKIDIYDIPINQITEQYIKYIAKMEELDLKITSDFLIMAATLLEIKSKLLLPKIEDEGKVDQNEIEDVDPRLELALKLAEYKQYKLVSKELRSMEEVQNKVYYKPQEDLSHLFDDEEQFEQLDLEELVKIFCNLLEQSKEVNRSIVVDQIHREKYILDDYIEKIKRKLNQDRRLKFSNILKNVTDRQEIIIIFLSLLELIRRRDIIIYQEDNFADILIMKTDREEISYG